MINDVHLVYVVTLQRLKRSFSGSSFSTRRKADLVQHLVEKDGSSYEQSSWSTIFSIWNTMIGSTLVALPYGFSQSGILLGLGIIVLVGSISCYTCNLVLHHGKYFYDLGDVVHYHFGSRLQTLSMICSVLVLLGACIAYHILMQESLYKIIAALIEWTSGPNSSVDLDLNSNTTRINATTSTIDHHLIKHVQHYYSWTPRTAALMILALFPITILKNAQTLVSMNSVGIPYVV